MVSVSVSSGCDGEDERCGHKREERRELHRRGRRGSGKRKSCAHDTTPHAPRLPVPQPRFPAPASKLFGPQIQIPNTPAGSDTGPGTDYLINK